MRDILFIWIPKTAGTSIFSSLEKQGMGKLKTPELYKKFDNKGMVTFGHVKHLFLLKNAYISQEYVKNAYKFAFVRNPWDRLASLFFYYKKEKIIIPQDMTFERFCYLVYESKIPPVGEYNRRGLSQCNQQIDWLDGGDIDFIGKYENLQNDFNIVCEQISIPKYKLGHMNKTGQSYKQHYTSSLIKLVGDIYKDDINKFNYDF